MTRPIRAVVALVVYAAGCILAGELTDIRSLARRTWRLLVDPSGSQFALAAMSLVSVFYFAMLVIRQTDFDIFDRYLLPILPWAATVLLLWCGGDGRAEQLRKRAMPFAWALLGILASYSIMSTEDLWALARGRAAAARKLEAAGVPRTAIDAGFEYNAWTQLTISGQMNSRWVVNPPGAYRPELSQTPSVVPVFRLEYAPTSESVPTEFGAVTYFSFLPPFHRRVSIDRLVGH